jgi:hypothetical protein
MFFFINNDFIINCLTFLYLIAKIYKIIFFIKVIFEQLPLFNPNKWPLSIIYILSSPITNFTQYYIPTIKLGPIELEVYFLLAFEIFDTVIEFLENIKNYFIEIYLANN